MANILLGVTGSVAAIRTPLFFRALTEAGHAVKVVATEPSLYFFEPAEIPKGALYRDRDEWPAERYRRDDPVLHIELRRWAELLLIAPLDANTLAKLATGLCDNCLTCIWRAWDSSRPVLLAPAMNTLMWENPLTRRHLKQLIELFGGATPSDSLDLDALVDWLNQHCPKLRMVGPRSKRLACGDVGIGGMAEVAEIVTAVAAQLAVRSIKKDNGHQKAVTMNMQEYLTNRHQFPHDELVKYAGKWVAWSPDGRRIIASDADPLQVAAAVTASGCDPAETVMESIPYPDEVVLGGGIGE